MDINDFSEHMVWVGDTGWGFGWNKWCGEFLKVITEARKLRQEKGLPTRWPIFIVDFTDNANVQRCKDVEAYMGLDYVKYHTRSLGKKREWDTEKNWVNFGELLNTTMENGKVYQHVPLIVRTDTIESLNRTLAARAMKLADPIERIPRSKDAIHLVRATCVDSDVCGYSDDSPLTLCVDVHLVQWPPKSTAVSTPGLVSGSQPTSAPNLDSLHSFR